MNIKRFQKRTAYNSEKKNKTDNFEFLNKNYCLKNQTVFAGDSITEICNMDLYNSYIAESKTLVYNRGISGDTSDRLLERFEKDVLCLEPKNLVLMIGTNDLSLKADVHYVADNIEKMIVMTKAKCPDTNLILQTLYPVEYKMKRKNAAIVQLNGILNRTAKRYDVRFLDLFDQFLDENNGLNKKYTYDGLHPNALGFEIAVKNTIPLFV